ncbi:hypothetical protein BGZ63DRAFT_406507 [Mariannaea sp. PMI_226]|nr:hypothetical protein BGZ63DRAFT_406507 [Mariannaea sp. PMI_226]
MRRAIYLIPALAIAGLALPLDASMKPGDINPNAGNCSVSNVDVPCTDRNYGVAGKCSASCDSTKCAYCNDFGCAQAPCSPDQDLNPHGSNSGNPTDISEDHPNWIPGTVASGTELCQVPTLGGLQQHKCTL